MNKLRVLEFQGLAPSVFCGQYFADLGCDVVIIARHSPLPFSIPIHENILNRNKKCICLSLKSHNDLQILSHLISSTDIIIDSFRPGVLEKLGFGYQECKKINPKVVLLRVSGYGQKGDLSLKPGHDLNYIALSGFLGKINQRGKPSFPNNYLADFVAASLGIMGVLVALRKREMEGVGDEVDCSLMHGVKYLSLFVEGEKEGKQRIWGDKSGEEIVEFQGKDGKTLRTKIIEMTELGKDGLLINYKKEGFVSESPTNPQTFTIPSPFLPHSAPISPTTYPSRGQHTASYLTSRNIPTNLIQASLLPHPKL